MGGVQRMPAVTATNMLYVVQFKEPLTQNEQAAWAMWFLTTRAHRTLRCVGRRYADGLLKFERRDIANLSIDSPVKTAGALDGYKRAVRFLLAGKIKECRLLADQWFDESEPSTNVGCQILVAYGE
jgi:hypothetical protein